jgi:hypothetical protein
MSTQRPCVREDFFREPSMHPIDAATRSRLELVDSFAERLHDASHFPPGGTAAAANWYLSASISASGKFTRRALTAISAWFFPAPARVPRAIPFPQAACSACKAGFHRQSPLAYSILRVLATAFHVRYPCSVGKDRAIR